MARSGVMSSQRSTNAGQRVSSLGFVEDLQIRGKQLKEGSIVVIES